MSTYPTLVVGLLGVAIIVIYGIVAFMADQEWKQYHDGRSLRATSAGLALFLFSILGITGTLAIAFPEQVDTIRAFAMLIRGSVLILGLWLLAMRRRA